MQGEAWVPGGCTLGSQLGFQKIGGVGGGGREERGVEEKGEGGAGRTARRLEAGGGRAWRHQDAEEVILCAGAIGERGVECAGGTRGVGGGDTLEGLSGAV